MSSNATDSTASSQRTVPLMTDRSLRVRETNTYANLKALLGTSPLSENLYHDIVRKHVPDTGGWIREHRKFRDWLTGQTPLVWLSGNPGYGKTYLCGNIVKSVQIELQSPDANVAYFFFRNSDTRTQSPLTALKCMALQISERDVHYANYLCDRSLNAEDLDSVSSAWRELFANYFLQMLGSRNPTYVIMDGLDEAMDDERVEFLNLLDDFRVHGQAGGTHALKLLFSARPYIIEDIQESLIQSASVIQISKEKNNQDIKTFLNKRINKLSALKSLSSQRRVEIANMVEEKADGMFLWCDLMIAQLSRINRQEDISKCLDEAPKGLEDMIIHVLASISANCKTIEDANDLNETLLWVTVCLESPSLWDLDVVLASSNTNMEPPLDWEGQLRSKYSCFFSISSVMKDDHSSDDDDDDNDDEDDEDDEEGKVENVENAHDSASKKRHRSTQKPEPPGGSFRNKDLIKANSRLSFRHAFIGEFFRRHKPVGSGTCPPIGVDSVNADVQGLLKCTEIIHRAAVDGLKEGWLQFQSVQIWQYLLEKASKSLSSYDRALKALAGKSIALLFLNKGVILHLRKRRGTKFFIHERIIQALQLWYADKDVCQDLSDDEAAWAKAGLLDSSKFFSIMKEVYAHQWLTRPSASPAIDAQIYEQLRQIGRLETQNRARLSFDWDEVDSAMEWEDVEQVATSFSFNQDSSWHWAVGLMLGIHQDESRELIHLEKALELDNGAIFVAEDLSNLYEHQGNLEDALITRKRVLALFMEKTKSCDADRRFVKEPHGYKKLTHGNILASLGRLHAKLNQNSLALECFRDGLDTTDGSFPCYSGYLKLLGELNESPLIKHTLKATEFQQGPENRTLLYWLFANLAIHFSLHQPILDAFSADEDLVWLETALIQSIKDTECQYFKQGLGELVIFTAKHYQRIGDSKKAQIYWNRSLTWTPAVRGPLISLHRTFATWCLSQAFDVIAERGQDDAFACLSDLKSLWDNRTMNEKQNLCENRLLAGLYLARWYQFTSQVGLAHVILREIILYHISKIESAGEKSKLVFNDWILQSLAIAGDVERVIACTNAPNPYLYSSEDEPLGNYLLSRHECDGNVLHSVRDQCLDSEEVNLCRYCEGSFCNKCLARIKSGIDPGTSTNCRKDHDWVKVPAIATKPVSRNGMWYRGAEVSFDNFAEGLREEWRQKTQQS